MKKFLALLALAVSPLLAQNVTVTKLPNSDPSKPNRLIPSSQIIIVPAAGSVTADPGGVIAATSIPGITIATTAPLTGGGALTGNLTLAIPVSTNSVDGYLSAADHTTFAAKQPAGNYITALTGDGTAAGPGAAAFMLATVNANVGTFAALTVNAKGLATAGANLSGDLTTAGAVATLATVNGNVGTFASVTVNGKGLVTAAGNLSGDLTTSAAVATLATVNSNVGSFGSSTAIPVFTVNGKGLITAASTTVVVAPAGTLTGATLAANVLASSLTSVGTLTGGATGAGFTVAIGTSTITGTLGVTNGGNGLATAILGDLRYGSGTNTLAALAGSTSTTMAVLTQTGNGTVSAAPVWTSTIGSGNIVRATSPTLVTPILGAATATSVNGLGFAGTGTLTLAGSLTTSGAFGSTFTMTGTTAVTFPTSGTLATTAATVASITGTANQISASASTGAVTLSIPSAFILPGTINGMTLTSSTGTFTLANLKTLTVSNTLTFTGTDSSSVAFGAGGTVLYSGGAYVSSFSAGTTGLTPNTGTTGAVTLAGTLATANGGTNLTSFTSGGLVQASSTSALTTTLTPAGLTSLGVNGVTSAAANNLTLGTASFGTALTFTSATGAATFAAGNLILGTTASLTLPSSSKIQLLSSIAAGAGVVFDGGGSGTGDRMYSALGDLTLTANGAAKSLYLVPGASGSVVVSGAILGSGGSAPTNSTSGSNQFTAGLATNGPLYTGGTGNFAGILNVTSTGISTFVGNIKLTGNGAGTGLFQAQNGSTDATIKGGAFGTGHYTNAQAAVIGMTVTSLSTTNIVTVGGGSGLYNAATSIDFYTAANNTTVTGTRAGGFSSTGAFDALGKISSGSSFQGGTPSGGTSAAWTPGAVITGITATALTTQYVQLDIGGTLYKLQTVTSVP